MKEINIKDLNYNVFDLLDDWCLVSAGNIYKYNSMTISWGGMGSIWNKYVVTIYIRPQRYTRKFIDENDHFTLSFFDKKYKNDLLYLGRNSGEFVDKMSNVSLNPIIYDDKVYFKESKMVLICRKLYCSLLNENGFVDQSIKKDMYKNSDYSYVYIGEIEKVLVEQ